MGTTYRVKDAQTGRVLGRRATFEGAVALGRRAAESGFWVRDLTTSQVWGLK